MVSGLKATSQCILLDKIDPKELNKEQLGWVFNFAFILSWGLIKHFWSPVRRAVWKIPFRLDEIPFFDTNFLCEPAQPTHFTSYEEEIEPWDLPLRRRNNVSTHISSHLYHTNRRESHYSDIGSDDGMLVNEPFSRDPEIAVKKIRGRRYDNSPRQSIGSPIEDPRPACNSPTPYSKPNVGNLREKFVSGDSNESMSFKKRAPQPPADSGRRASDHKLLKKGPAPPRPSSPHHPSKADPIREMESIAKQVWKLIYYSPWCRYPISAFQATPDPDDPPFNFQGMLRKTKYNRNSMKRNNDSKLSLPSEDFNNNSGKKNLTTRDNNTMSGHALITQGFNAIFHFPEPYVETSQTFSNVVFHSKAIGSPKPTTRAKSPDIRKNSCSAEALSVTSNGDENCNFNFVQEEIAPGKRIIKSLNQLRNR